MNIFTRKTVAVGLTMTGLLALCQPAQSMSSSEGPGEGASEASGIMFHPMFLVGKGSGSFMVTRPGCKAENGAVGHAYPFGSRVSASGAAGTKVVILLAPNDAVLLGSGCEVVLENDPEADGAKRIQLLGGQLETTFSKDDESVFPLSIVTPSAVFDDIDGRVGVSVAATPSSAKAGVIVTDGKVTVHAPQLHPSRIGNGAGLVVDTKSDGTYTMIENLAGDYTLFLENGNEADYQVASHVGSRIKIWRSWAPLSKLLAVSLLITDADGAVVDSYAFNEGQAPIKNGVSVAREDSGAEAEAENSAGADDVNGLGDDFASPTQDAAAVNAADDSGWDFNF